MATTFEAPKKPVQRWNPKGQQESVFHSKIQASRSYRQSSPSECPGDALSQIGVDEELRNYTLAESIKTHTHTPPHIHQEDEKNVITKKKGTVEAPKKSRVAIGISFSRLSSLFSHSFSSAYLSPSFILLFLPPMAYRPRGRVTVQRE